MELFTAIDKLDSWPNKKVGHSLSELRGLIDKVVELRNADAFKGG